MVKRFLVVLVLVIFSSSVFAETIYLKDGKILRGSITEETNETITVETENQWKKINRKDIEKIVKDKQEIRASTIKSSDIKFNFGPKVGIFYPTDGDVSDTFDVNLLWGINATIWVKQIGFQFEFEKYVDITKLKDPVIYYLYDFDTDTEYSGVITEQKLSLTPVWFSLLYRGDADIYGFIGAGIGWVEVKNTVEIMGFNSGLYDNFLGLQLITGFGGKHAGLSVKYSFVSTNKEWGDVDLGGLTTTFNIYF